MGYGKVDFEQKIETKSTQKSEPNDGVWEGDKNDASAMGLGRSDEALVGAICPNCGARLEGRKCKLFCPTPGCGYLVTCSEF